MDKAHTLGGSGCYPKLWSQDTEVFVEESTGKSIRVFEDMVERCDVWQGFCALVPWVERNHTINMKSDNVWKIR
jgi:hypothetical protein